MRRFVGTINLDVHLHSPVLEIVYISLTDWMFGRWKDSNHAPDPCDGIGEMREVSLIFGLIPAVLHLMIGANLCRAAISYVRERVEPGGRHINGLKKRRNWRVSLYPQHVGRATIRSGDFFCVVVFHHWRGHRRHRVDRPGCIHD